MHGHLPPDGIVSGDEVTFVGGAMAAVVRAVGEVHALLGQAPVVVGGLAVMCRLTTPYRATTDLDIVDRRSAGTPHLEVLRRAEGAHGVEPAAVLLPTPFGQVRVDVLEVRQIELDRPSDDPGDRLHASAHAWAADTAAPMTIRVHLPDTTLVEVTTPIAEPGALVAMKLQAVMDRGAAKHGTDLQDVVRLVLDPEVRDPLLDQVAARDPRTAADVAHHVEHWLVRHRSQTLRRIVSSGGGDLTLDDIDLTAELLRQACREAGGGQSAGHSA